MELHLVDGDGHLGDRQCFLQVGDHEVAHTDAANLALLYQLGHSRERFCDGDLIVGPVDQQQVEIVNAQFLEGTVAHRQDIIIMQLAGRNL